MPIKDARLNLHSMRAQNQFGRQVATSTSIQGQRLKEIILVTDEVIRSKRTLCSGHRVMGREFPMYSPLGRRFADLMKLSLQEIEWHFPNHEFSPLYIIFKRATKHLRFAHPYHTVADTLLAIRRLRRFGRSTALKLRLESMKRGERNTRTRVRELCGNLRAMRSKVVALRVDLGLHVLHARGEDLVVPAVGLAEFKGYRSGMTQWLDRGRLSKHILAYIWKLEWGIDKGYHIHLAVMLDGHQVRADSLIGDIIGRTWEQDITGGKGMFWNCNRDKQRYERCALGTLHRSDDHLWACLETDVLEYLTKSDFFMRLQVPEKTRTFGIGGLLASQRSAESMQIPLLPRL